MQNSWNIATKAIHSGKTSDPNGALVSPINQSATFVFDSVQQGGARFSGDEQGYIYTRLGNPTTTELENKIAALEGAEDAAATASGMAAVSSALLANLSQGDHVIASRTVYGCCFSLMTHQFSRFGIETTFVDFTDIEKIQAAIKSNTKVLFCETPVNPNLEVYDLSAIAKLGKQNELTTIVDNTFMTPILQRPLEFGIDMVVHSATKYLNGHGDVVAGIVCGNKEIMAKVKFEIIKDIGGIISPHDAWLILRGLKTLDVRVQRHCDNAEKVAEFLESHSKVAKVYYPGLASHQGSAFLGKQMLRAGGVIAFELDADLPTSMNFVNSLALFSIAVSLGDAESLIQHPASMTHSPYTEEARVEAGITDSLIRISVGLENVSDIIHDLETGLAKL